MKCSFCGREFPGDGSDGTHPACCPQCPTATGAAPQEAFQTRPLTSQERAAFLFPERFVPDLLLGEGAFGVVYRCWDQQLRRHVAIKHARNPSINQAIFLREARAASQLDHPGIVRIFDVGERGGQAFIVSEFVDGGTLKQWLKDHAPDFGENCRICGEIASAVAAAHERGVVHRDLKPGNILMDTDGRPRLVDFGLSHSRNSGLDTLNVEGRPIGTPACMAPEQVEGRSADIGPASDVYSIGVVLYQMLTGRLPFKGRAPEIMRDVLTSDPPAPRTLKASIPAPLDAICCRAMARDLAKRYSSAGRTGR